MLSRIFIVFDLDLKLSQQVKYMEQQYESRANNLRSKDFAVLAKFVWLITL